MRACPATSPHCLSLPWHYLHLDLEITGKLKWYHYICPCSTVRRPGKLDAQPCEVMIVVLRNQIRSLSGSIIGERDDTPEVTAFWKDALIWSEAEAGDLQLRFGETILLFQTIQSSPDTLVHIGSQAAVWPWNRRKMSALLWTRVYHWHQAGSTAMASAAISTSAASAALHTSRRRAVVE